MKNKQWPCVHGHKMWRVAKFEEIWQFGMAINTGDTAMLTMGGQIQSATDDLPWCFGSGGGQWAYVFLSLGSPTDPRPPPYRGFEIALRNTSHSVELLRASDRTVADTSIWQKKNNTNKKEISTPPAGFQPAIPVSEWLQTQTLDRAATGTGWV